MSNSFARIKELSPEQRDLLLQRLAQANRHGREPVRMVPLRREGASEAPLSFAQERQWFLDRLSPGDPAYIITGGLRCKGKLSVPALSAAFGEIVRRHETLRANIRASAGQPIAVINPPRPYEIDFIDLSGLEAEARRTECDRLYAEETQRGFDLARDQLLRTRLIRMHAGEHFLIFSMHHIASDGWSIGILLEELSRHYLAFSTGRTPELAELPIQYGDFAAWQRDRMQGGGAEQGLSYWRKQLANPPPVLELRPDRLVHDAASTERDLAAAASELLVDRKLKQGLEELSRQEDATLFVALLTAFMALLMRCTGQEDILIGSPVSGRIRLETESLVGLFLNTLALRARLSPDLSFRQALAIVRKTVLDGLAHHEVSFDRVVQDLDPERSSSSHPLFETFFNFTPSPPRTLELPGLSMNFEAPVAMRSEFSTVLYVTEWEGTLDLRLVFQRQRYSKARMSCLLEQLHGLLQQVALNPDQTLGSFDLSTTLSRAVLPDPTLRLDAPEQEPVQRQIHDIAARYPRQPAICQGETVLSYAELAAAMRMVAGRLRKCGLQNGEVVAVLGPRSPGFITAMAGTLAAGGVLLTLSPDLPEQRHRLMLQQSGARVLLHVGSWTKQDAWLHQISGLSILELEASGLAVNNDEPSVSAASAGSQGRAPRSSVSSADSWPEPNGHDPAYIFFTSGSTGTPKAVLGTHAGLAQFLAWQRQTFDVGPHDRCAQLTGVSFDVVLRDVFLPLTSGAALVLPTDGDVASGERTLRWLDRERITLVHTVPSVADVWLLDRPADVSLCALKRLFFAGEPLSAALVARWRQAFPLAGQIINLYGPTETTLAKCFYRVPGSLRAGVQPLGTAIPHAQALVLTPARTLCSIGEPGEIAIRTPFRSLGYLNAQPETERRFVVNPFTGDPNDKLYLTGDRGAYRADGVLEFLGRIDDQVKVRGVRVEPMEVAAILKEAPDVAACAVVMRGDGPGGPALVAYVVLHKGAGENAQQLREFLRQRLPAPMTPSAFVFLDHLPLNSNQKLDRERLPAPHGGRTNLESQYVAPRDVTELRLMQIWEDLLDIRPIGVADSFFDLGGHSLLALRLLVKIEQSLGRKVPLAALLRNPTIAHLAAVMRQPDDAQPQLVPLWTAKHRQALFLVHTGGGTVLNYVPLVRHLASPLPVYGLQARGLDGQGEPHRDMREMAADYIAKIRAVQPDGPYLLAGHSFGGMVAFEMARQMLTAGHAVALLAMFDSVLSRPDEDTAAIGHSREADARMLADAVAAIGRFVGRQIDLPVEALRDLSPDARIARALEAVRSCQEIPFEESARMVRNLLDIGEAHSAARAAYHPEPVPVSIVLLRARDARTDGAAADVDAVSRETLGWSRVSTQPVQVLWAPGDHVTMMGEPNVRSLAASLQSLVAAAVRPN